MAEYSGKNLYIKFTYATSKNGTAAGTVTLSGNQRTMSVNRSLDTADVSAGADTHKSYIQTLEDTTISLTMLDDGTAAATIRAAIAPGNWGTLEFGPEGTTTGKPKYTLPVHVTSFSTEYPYDGEVEYDISFQGDGAWTGNYEDSNASVY